MSETLAVQFDYASLRNEIGNPLVRLDSFVLRVPIAQVKFVAGEDNIIFFDPDLRHDYLCHNVGLRQSSFYQGDPGDAGKLGYKFLSDGTLVREIFGQSNAMTTGVLVDMAVRRIKLMEKLGPRFSLGQLTTQTTFQSPDTLEYRVQYP